MTTALVATPENDQMFASWSLDAIVVGHGVAPEMDTVAHEMTLPVRPAHLLHMDVLPKGRPGSLVARWVPDPLGEQGLVCLWVPQTGTEASAGFDA